MFPARRTGRSRAGTSLIEALISLGVLVVTAGGLGAAVMSTQKATAEIRQRDMVRAQAMRYVERLLGVPFGTATDSAPSAAEVQDMFDDDGTVPAGVTLMSLRTPADDEGWRFRVGGFEVPGAWAVEVNSDLDGNGSRIGIRGTETPTTGDGTTAGDGVTPAPMQSEGRPGLVRIEVFFNGVSVARTLRAAPIQAN